MTKKLEELKVRWRPGYRPPNGADAEKVKAELEAVAAANGGRFDAAQALERAKDKKSELHKIPTWNKAKAARLYNLDEMRRAARAIEVEFVESPGTPSRAFQHDTTQEKQENGYKPYRSLEDVLADPVARTALLQRALNDLISCRRKYSALQELSIVFRAIDETLETVKA